MAAGCAIVSTHVGAQGLNVTNGQEIVLADHATAFAQATIALLRDPAQRARLGQAARTLACNEYDWSAIVPRLVQVYKELKRG